MEFYTNYETLWLGETDLQKRTGILFSNNRMNDRIIPQVWLIHILCDVHILHGFVSRGVHTTNSKSSSGFLTIKDPNPTMTTRHLILMRHAEEENTQNENAGLTVIGECSCLKTFHETSSAMLNISSGQQNVFRMHRFKKQHLCAAGTVSHGNQVRRYLQAMVLVFGSLLIYTLHKRRCSKIKLKSCAVVMPKSK